MWNVTAVLSTPSLGAKIYSAILRRQLTSRVWMILGGSILCIYSICVLDWPVDWNICDILSSATAKMCIKIFFFLPLSPVKNFTGFTKCKRTNRTFSVSSASPRSTQPTGIFCILITWYSQIELQIHRPVYPYSVCWRCLKHFWWFFRRSGDVTHPKINRTA